MNRQTMGVAIVLGIVSGIVLEAWYHEGTQPVVYASGQTVELIEREVQIATHITWTEDRIKEEIRQVFPDAPIMLKVAACESGFRPQVIGPTSDHGIFQIHEPSHGVRTEALGLDMFDPKDNVAFARMLYDES